MSEYLEHSTLYISLCPPRAVGFSVEMYSLLPLRMADIIALHRGSLLGEVSKLEH
jgi:hypothetical protein